jgi:hypothetical protein
MSYVLLPVHELEDGALSLKRIEPEMDALKPDELSMVNLDIVVATCTVLGQVDHITKYRDRMIPLATEFEVRNIDSLRDYARATWHLHVANLPVTPASEFEAVMQEVGTLRNKLLIWGTALAATGSFDPAALDKIRAGGGHKDLARDLVGLVVLFRSRWDDVKNKCDVTEADLERGAQLGPAAFSMIGTRESPTLTANTPEGALRVRRAWTLLDRAYTQCRRVLQFLRFEQGDADLIAPSLRRNRGVPSSQGRETGPVAPAPVVPSVPTAPAVPTGPAIGDGASPFISGNGLTSGSGRG